MDTIQRSLIRETGLKRLKKEQQTIAGKTQELNQIKNFFEAINLSFP